MKITANDTLSLDEIEALKAKAMEADQLRAELAQAKERLKAEKESFYKFLDNLPFFAYLQEKDYSIRFANRVFKETYGESAGRRCHQVIWGREAPCESCPTFRVFETGEPVSWESIHQDGRAFQVYDLPFSDPDGTELVLEISIDKTHCRKLERERSSVLAQLMHSQKMSAIGTLTAGIAHDFNNIITVIKTLTDLASSKVDSDGPLIKLLEPIKESSDRAISLVQQLLVFSRHKPSNRASHDMNEVVEDILRMLEHLVSEDISIETDFAYDLWPVLAVRCMLEQIILNLVINSSEAMPQGGSIVIKTGNVTIAEKAHIDDPGPRPGRYVLLAVEDSGSGMDGATLKRVFEPLFTTKEKKNAGMGLTVVQKIVNEHGGWIGAESEHGKGTSFKIYLPAAEEASRAPECGGGQKPVPGVGKGKKVLLVEDEKWVRKSTAMVLSEYGYSVTEAANAEAALSLFYREKGRFDLVLTDVIMPGRNGLQLVGPLLDINPAIPILLFSAHLDDRVQMEDIIKRGIAYIQKPYEIPDLISAVEETILTANKSPRRK
jgi:two-component system cell cycle sensor histidine kinase/response regulator CckA